MNMDMESMSQVESVCMQCHEDGITNLLLTDVPYFRQIVICSFTCPHCGFRSNEVMPAAALAENGVRYVLRVNGHDELNRQIIKSNDAEIRIPLLEFTIPAGTQTAKVNTVEGFLAQAAEDLQTYQPQRREIDPETTDKLQTVIDRLVELSQGSEPFILELEDISGNSFIENPFAPQSDAHLDVEYFERTPEQLEALGYAAQDKPSETPSDALDAKQTKKLPQNSAAKVSKALLDALDTHFDVTSQAAMIPGTCEGCLQPAETRMCVTQIPHFKEVILMVSQCEHCGLRDAEVKPGGAIEDYGTKVTLSVTGPEDLKRDLLKSDTAGISIPEVELEMMSGTLGGKYTTVEGILGDIYEQLETSNPFGLGDSGQDTVFCKWLADFKELCNCEKPFTFILDDPMGNAFIFAEPNDPNVVVEHYERTEEQKEDFGLNDMKLEGYEQDE